MGKIVGRRSVAVQVRVTNDGAVQQVVIKCLELPILRIGATPMSTGARVGLWPSIAPASTTTVVSWGCRRTGFPLTIRPERRLIPVRVSR
jgi:hypothetical protein